MITISQCRAARGLLGWTQQDLADASGLSKTAINNFEKGHSDIKAESLNAIRLAFESASIEFMADEGLRRRAESAQILKGHNALSNLLDDIYETMKTIGGEVLISHVDESFTAQVSPKKILEHLDRMKSHGISGRVLCTEGSGSILAPDGHYRWLPKSSIMTTVTTFVYGPKVAFELCDNTMIIVVSSREASNFERLRFEKIWATAAIPPAQRKQGAQDSA